MKTTRRTFLAATAAAATAAVMPPKEVMAAVSGGSYATMIDLTLCDGCPDKDTPACITSCRTVNKAKFPEPDPKMLKNYWPQNKFEDWSKKRGLKSRLTPYNWIFVQKVKVEQEGELVEVNVPRRCMHCDSPACVKLCPFGVNYKNTDGTVTIDPFLCFGGAKCRDVCPWSVPQRQAGVGFYTTIDPIPAGGGVMFKCDLCRDRLRVGKLPGCVEACPRKALTIGTRDEIYAIAEKRAKEVGGHIYGANENGGTSTLYVSTVPFEKIDEALVKAAKDPKKVMRMHRPGNMLEKYSGMAWLSIAAPIAGIATAFAATLGKKKKESGDDK